MQSVKCEVLNVLKSHKAIWQPIHNFITTGTKRDEKQSKVSDVFYKLNSDALTLVLVVAFFFSNHFADLIFLHTLHCLDINLTGI